MERIYYMLRDWWEATFMPVNKLDPEAIISKLEEETGELISAVRRYENGLQRNRLEIGEEIADATMVLFQLAQKYGMCYNTFLDNIRTKHNVNRKRTWTKQPDGSYKGSKL